MELKEGILTISAQHEEKQEKRDDQGQYLCRERRVGSFVRSFDASGIQEDAIRASYENGVLTLIPVSYTHLRWTPSCWNTPAGR